METMHAEAWLRLLSRMPGVVWSMRKHPTTGKVEWAHNGPRKLAVLYDMTEAELVAEPKAFLPRILVEDRGRLEQLMAHGEETLSPWSWSGRIVTNGGEIRWIEMQAVIESDADGTRVTFGHALDVTERKRVEHALAESEAELRARDALIARSEEAKAEILKRMRAALDELTTPILEVWDGVLALPIVGLVDSRRTADMVQQLLAAVARTQASFVIVDLTGVDIIDTKTADHLMKLMRKVEIVGAKCVLTGIQPAVAETLIDIGVDFGSVTTLRNLKHGLRAALETARRERAELTDEDLLEDEPEKEPKARKSIN